MFENFKLRKRLTEVEEDLEAAKRRITALEVQWGDTLDRLKSMMGRLYKERVRTERASAAEQPDTPEAGPIGTDGDTLSYRQREINARILARRNRSAQ